MLRICEQCGELYDDVNHGTICPHEYFTIHYACIAATYYLSKWEFARRGRAMQDAMHEKRAAENVAGQDRQPNWKDFTN